MLIACRRCHRQYDTSGIRAGRRVRCVCGELNTVPAPRSVPATMSHCHSCGGPLRGRTDSCAYCGGEVSLRMRGGGGACPECLRQLPRDASFCPSCGVAIQVTSVVRALASTRCPRCRGELAQCQSARTSFTECLSCGGLWLDDAVFRSLIEQKRTVGSAARRGRERGFEDPPHGAREAVRYLACPHCGELMHRRNFGPGSGVVVDECAGHGVWLDALELDRILAYAERHPDRARWEDRTRGRAAAPRSVPVEKEEPKSNVAVLDLLADLISGVF